MARADKSPGRLIPTISKGPWTSTTCTKAIKQLKGGYRYQDTELELSQQKKLSITTKQLQKQGKLNSVYSCFVRISIYPGFPTRFTNYGTKNIIKKKIAKTTPLVKTSSLLHCQPCKNGWGKN